MSDAITLGSVPVVDLANARTGDPFARASAAAEVGAACELLGFLVVRGHGVETSLIDAMLDHSRRFFDLDHTEKLRYCPPSPYIFRGFFPAKGSALAGSLEVETPPDLCEVFAANRFDDPAAAVRAGLSEGREAFFAPNIWPDIAGFREAWQAYYSVMEGLANEILRLMALDLGLSEDWFDDKVNEHISNLVVNHYPAQDEPPLAGQLRRGAHTDFGSITIMYQDDSPGGLQVLLADDSWADVPHVPGTFIVNLGDLLAAWTNDRWVSTMHRAINPNREDARRSRLSIPFFHQPNYDALIECIPTCLEPGEESRHPPVRSGDWVLDKLSKSIT